MVPFDTKSPQVTSGIRIGTPAITTRGLKEADCEELATYIDSALKNSADYDVLESIKAELSAKMRSYPLFQY
jgi:glycine hydroxymethyltransferase